jgi:1,4-dihydroxy-2-naphthoyl-CoA hydrolase
MRQTYISAMEDLLEKVNAMNDSTLMGSLGIRFTHVEKGYLEATMPVDHRTHQPYGLLHGGASAALAETLGSYGSHVLVGDSGGIGVGVELNINHLKSKRHGTVTGKAKILHQGKTTHVWNIDIVDEEGVLLATSRLTVLVKTK